MLARRKRGVGADGRCGFGCAGRTLLIADSEDNELAVERSGEHSQGGGECPGGECDGAQEEPDGKDYESGVHRMLVGGM